MGPEADIDALLLAGDAKRAAEEAIRAYGPSVLGLLHRLLARPELADDAFSLFAEQLWSSMATFERRATMRTWCFRLARNVAITVQRESWQRNRRRLATTEAERIAEDVRTKSALRLERQSQVVTRLARHFSLDEQTLLSLRVDQRMTWDEIAEVLSSPEEPVGAPALRKRFERLTEKLRDLARDEGLLE
jgi:RNA polymerase sigma-70 factor (ECF subfamily)